MRRTTLWRAGLALVLATPAAAQTPTVKGSIRGLVYDSLVASGPLVGATIELLELGRAVTTDGRGAFRFDSLPGGRFTLSWTHPSLAATGYTPPDRIIDLTAGLDIVLSLTTPSAASVYHRLCPGPRDARTGVLLGTLTDAGSGKPIVAGEVRGEWTESSFSRAGLIKRPRTIRAGPDSSGRYRLCGVPTDVPVLLRVLVAGIDGPPLELRMEDRPMVVRHLTATTDTASRGRAQLTGRITANGRGLAEAQVLVLGTPAVARTGPDGSFTLADLPAGSHTVEARAIGYARKRLLIDLKETGTEPLALDLARLPVELPELKVAGAQAGSNGFDERRRLNNGGHFITGEELTRKGTIRVEDAFKGLPGVKVAPAGLNDYYILSTRGGSGFGAECEFTVYVDDVRIPLDPENGLGIPVMPQDVRGIEVHQGPNSAPIQYQSSNNNCGVILIWTKRGRR